MSVDASQLNQPAAQPTSPTSGAMAPPTFEQVFGSSTPGSGQAPQVHQPVPGGSGQEAPAQQQGQPSGFVPPVPGAPVQQPQQAPAQPSAPDAERRLQQIEAERAREQQELNQYRQGMTRLQQMAAEQQRNQDFQNRVRMITAATESMDAAQAQQYIEREVGNLLAAERMQHQQQSQMTQQQYEQQIRLIVAPQYADYLVQEMQLPPEAKAELVALRDPDLMREQAPHIKARYDGWAAQMAQLQGGQQQMSRAQEVQALSNAGFGNFGGQNAGAMQLTLSDDPDEKAMQILDLNRRGYVVQS